MQFHNSTPSRIFYHSVTLWQDCANLWHVFVTLLRRDRYRTRYRVRNIVEAELEKMCVFLATLHCNAPFVTSSRRDRSKYRVRDRTRERVRNRSRSRSRFKSRLDFQLWNLQKKFFVYVSMLCDCKFHWQWNYRKFTLDNFIF